MFRKSSYLVLVAVLFLYAGCDKLEYSYNQRFDKNTPSNINATNLKLLLSSTPDDTLRFILSGDTQRGYDEAQDFVKKANSMHGIDFVVIAGDISDFGLLQEMEWIADIYTKLKVPYIGVIGNHDMAANGTNIFERIFGEQNYSFVYSGVKFICLNTNSREVNYNNTIPDINWPNSQVLPQPGVTGYIAISHVNPFSVDFDKDLEMPFVQALERSGNCLASLHAHDHNSGQYKPYNNNIPFIVSSAILKKEFTLIEVIDGKLQATEITY